MIKKNCMGNLWSIIQQHTLKNSMDALDEVSGE
jgi:hypothetical protein